MKSVPMQIKKDARFCSRILIGVCLIAFFSHTAVGQRNLQTGSSADEVQGSGLNLSLIRETAAGHFRVELHNAGTQALILNVGMMLGNGRKQYADRLHLLLTDPQGKQLHLEALGPATINGRVDPMVVPLPAGATYTLPIDLRNYIAPREKVWELVLAPGRYVLTAEYRGAGVPRSSADSDMQGIALMPFWLGDVSSRQLAFTLQQEWTAHREPDCCR